MYDTTFGEKILRPAEFGIIKRLGRAIGGSRDDAAPLGALNHFSLQVINRHRPGPRAISGRNPNLGSPHSASYV
jgi:hypothetical protein